LQKLIKFQPELNSEAIIDFLSFGSIRQPKTLYKDVAWLPKASYGIFKGNKFHITQYWDLIESATPNKLYIANLNYAEAVALLREKLEEATKYHLISDVQIGAFLSGGVDSTAVLALMNTVYEGEINTYTLGFEGEFKYLDESDLAIKTSQKFNTNHKNLFLTKDYFLSRIPDFFKSLDQPSIDGFNTYLISELAKEDVKVILSGLGGDELFLGYNYMSKFKNLRNDSNYNFINKLPLFSKFPNRVKNHLILSFGSFTQKLLTIRRYNSFNHASHILENFNINSTDLTHYQNKIIFEFEKYNNMELEVLNNLSLFEMDQYIPNTLLRDSDVMAMRHGLELRPVLLDHELVEFVFSLPSSYKLNKRIFKDSISDLLPNCVLSAAKKGFELPYDKWLSGYEQINVEPQSYKYNRAELYLNQFLKYN
jgi:asparagine synthase (glutamine-hydrolysing)